MAYKDKVKVVNLSNKFFGNFLNLILGYFRQFCFCFCFCFRCGCQLLISFCDKNKNVTLNFSDNVDNRQQKAEGGRCIKAKTKAKHQPQQEEEATAKVGRKSVNTFAFLLTCPIKNEFVLSLSAG